MIKNDISLNEELGNQINYKHRDIVAISKNNFKKAKDLLKKNPEFVEELNAVKDSRNNIKQFLKTEQQRDLLVAAYILARNKNKAHALDVNLQLNDEEQFQKYAKIVADRARKAANLLDVDNPSIKQVKELKDANFDPEAASEIIKRSEDTPETGSQEETPSDTPETGSQEETPNETPETGSQEETPNETPEKNKPKTSFPPESDSEEEAEIDQEKEKKSSSVVDEEDFPSPSSRAKKIEEIRDRTIKEIQDIFSKVKTPNRDQMRSHDNAKKAIESKLNGLIKRAEDLQRGYEVHPTRSSAMKSSTSAKKILADAKTFAENQVLAFRRKQFPNALQRAGMKAGEIKQGVKDTASSITGSRIAKLAREKVGRLKKTAGEAAGRITAAAKEKTAAVQASIQQKTKINTISKFLGEKWAQKYIEALKEKNYDAIKQIEKTLENKKTNTKIDKNKTDAANKEAKRIKKLDNTARLRKEREALSGSAPWNIPEGYKNKYIKSYINELAKNPATSKEVDVSNQKPKEIIASTEKGKKNVEDYVKNVETGKLEDAKKILDDAKEQAKKRKEQLEKETEKIEQEVETKNESVKRALRALYN